jgi:hypothetical protein
VKDRREVEQGVLDESLMDEIVQLYEAGVPIAHIVAQLRERGLAANWHWVDAALDRCQIIRHSKAGVIPRGATEGFSVGTLKRIWGEVISTGRGDGARVVRRGDLVHRRRMRATFQTYGTFGGRGLPVGDDGHSRLNKYLLTVLAERHAEGKGETLRSLAARIRMDESSLAHSLRDAGYVVQTNAEWTERELQRLTGEIVSMYRDEEKPLPMILDQLRRQYEVFISERRLRSLLEGQDVPIRTEHPRSRPASMPPSDSRWRKIHGREEELAQSILDRKQTTRAIADELGVDHIWLAQALRRTGHLPDMPLHHYWAWKKSQG